MLEVGRGARCSAKCRRVERAASRSEQQDAPQAAADLEPTRVKVSVRNAVAGDVENRPQKECRELAADSDGTRERNPTGSVDRSAPNPDPLAASAGRSLQDRFDVNQRGPVDRLQWAYHELETVDFEHRDLV